MIGTWLPLLATLAAALGAYALKVPCGSHHFWGTPKCQDSWTRYTDVSVLFWGRGLAGDHTPYIDSSVEYPVIIGWFMQVANIAAGWFTEPGGEGSAVRAGTYFDVTALGMTLMALLTVYAVGRAAGRLSTRARWMVVAAPTLTMTMFINWDLLAVALTVLALVAWNERGHFVAGVLLGMAIATKFYPIILFWPFLLLCFRAGRMREFSHLLAGAVVIWIMANLPVALAAQDNWLTFYKLSSSRDADWGSIFYLLDHKDLLKLEHGELNLVSSGIFAALCLLIGFLALKSPRAPRLTQLMFLVLAAFLLTNKVWSPQYVLWLLPLAVLARPKLPGFLIWQAAEVVYVTCIWWYLSNILSPPGGISEPTYFYAVLARFAAVVLMCLLIVWDILRPGADKVRRDGEDDPAGGVLSAEPRYGLAL